ncbi:metallophosphatase family protein [Lederbergia panacisoli]|nr:metallophosphatase family protein [Lederbergia panacisoli]MCR2823618.1 metallophosphatase family protein [Lederbergia panacisoli]
MRIGIITDIHDNAAALKAVLDELNHSKLVIETNIHLFFNEETS